MKQLIMVTISFLLIYSCNENSEKKKMDDSAYFYLGTYSTALGHADGKAEGISLEEAADAAQDAARIRREGTPEHPRGKTQRQGREIDGCVAQRDLLRQRRRTSQVDPVLELP